MTDTAERTPSVLVVVSNNNGRVHLAYSLLSLGRTEHPHFEILVIDDRSTDGSLSYLAREFPGVRALASRRSPGFAGAVNSGIEEAARRGFDYVAVANNDIKVHPRWLSAALESPPPRTLIGFTERPLSESDGLSGTGAPLAPVAFRAVDGIPGCLYLCPVDVFREVGLFDETYFMYGEDNDFFCRLRRRGVGLVLSNIPVWHFGEGSELSRFLVTWLAYRNGLRCAIKNDSPMGVLRMTASLLNQGCNPFLRPATPSPNYRRLRRFPPPGNFLVWAAAIVWNAASLPWTLKARYSSPERLSSAGSGPPVSFSRR